MRFQLIDRIQRLEPRKSIAAIKNLSLAEEYLADHFPGFPVLPGVLMIEALTQAGAWLMKASEEFAYSTVMLRQAKAVKFNSFVSPGKALAVSLDVVSWVDGECTLKGTGTVDGLSAVSARLVLKRFNLADANPSMAKADALAIDAAKDVFRQIWQPAG
jgi:3-hydroxyacyl-[acyl-carrier-protein] dehydratase